MTAVSAPAESHKKQRKTIIISALLFVVTFGCFWPATRNAFINMDDIDYITQNPHVQAGLRWSTIKWAFTTFHAGNWHPLTWLSHALDCQLFGMNAIGHHATSVVLHALNTVLLFWALLAITTPGNRVSSIQYPVSSIWPCAAVAALFALHPMHVESVA